jgi:hypothetical protein
MQVGRKGTLLLLAIVVFWAAMPSFACLKAAARPSCCQGEMQNCTSPATMTSPDCCAIHPSPAPILPGSAISADHRLNPAALRLAPEPALRPNSAWAGQSFSADSPPRSFSATASILRI